MDGEDEAKRTGEFAAVELLAGSDSAEQATRRLLELLSGLFDARVVVLWSLDAPAGLLRWAEDWAPEPAMHDFVEACRRLSFPRGAGFPGEAWDTGASIWSSDIRGLDGRFARLRVAAEAGLRSVAEIPVHGRTALLGVMELFWADTREEDRQRTAVLETIARLLGAYLERSGTEELLAVSEGLRTAMVNAALDCIVTIDSHSRVVDFNPAAVRTFGYTREEAIGARLGELIIPEAHRARHYHAVERLVGGGAPVLLDQRIELEAMRADGSIFPVELTITRIDARDDPLFVGFVRDITDRRRAQDELTRLLEREQAARMRAERAEQAARRIAQTLQRSLLPPVLPQIPGIDLAAGFQAGGDETEVGGDFYDIFETRPGLWAWVIGDVCGKGAQAAALTALARHTLRAAAMQEPLPSDVLRALNHALLREQPRAGLLTAAFGVLDLANDPLSLTLAMGGHPPLLITRAHGEVETVGAAGMLLGAVADPELADVRTTLAAGDALVAYTDGVTEARVGDGRLELEGLIRALRACRGMDASAIGREIERAAQTAERRPTDDDVAYLVMRVVDAAAA